MRIIVLKANGSYMFSYFVMHKAGSVIGKNLPRFLSFFKSLILNIYKYKYRNKFTLNASTSHDHQPINPNLKV